MPLPPDHVSSAVSAVSQGQLTQLRLIVEDIYERLSESGDLGTKLDTISPAKPPEDDSKTVDVREAVIELTEKFNQLLYVLKGKNDG